MGIDLATVDTTAPGRVCPVRYRYSPTAIADIPEKAASTLYVVGGLYGNPFALDALEAMVRAEKVPVSLCFNGDFNWLNVDSRSFADVNRRVLAHDAILGNVEAELISSDGDAGCGCAYPADVDDDVVERSNRIQARLSAVADSHKEVLQALDRLSMYARYRVGELRIGVVHGDLQSLAGWDFDIASLARPDQADVLRPLFRDAEIDVVACSHTCSPILRDLGVAGSGAASIVANNGAAGLPNFKNTHHGVITRISVEPSPHRALYGLDIGGVAIDALPLFYDHDAWVKVFLGNWPEGSDAHRSYYARISRGPDYQLECAAP